MPAGRQGKNRIEFRRAIEAKQVAERLAMKAQRDLERIKIEAEQKITQAKAEADPCGYKKKMSLLI